MTSKIVTPESPSYPILQSLIDSGTITWLGTDLIGHASDGTIVNMGSESNLPAIERYLAGHPTPAEW